ncbi:hypothetical protein ACFY4C_37380 [Actinomadura viridis]|uniref:hypothetical protein n=1 Tax=Actinomadura viridis TaxID=58110 RepID=UPI003692CD92
MSPNTQYRYVQMEDDMTQEHQRPEQAQAAQEQGTEGETWGWTRAFTTREICDRVQDAVSQAFTDAMLIEGVPEDVRGRVASRARTDLAEHGDLELWAAQIPPTDDPSTICESTDPGQKRVGVVLDACSLMRFRLVVPSWRSADHVASQAAESITRTHARLMQRAGCYARAEAEARDTGDDQRLARVRLRAQAIREAAEILEDALWTNADLDLFVQVLLTDSGASREPLDTDDETDQDRWIQVPGLPWPNLHDELALPRPALVAMIEQVRAVREHFAGMALRCAFEAAEQTDTEATERRAMGWALAMCADMIDAALAAGAGRGDDLGEHIARHGRQIDYVI